MPYTDRKKHLLIHPKLDLDRALHIAYPDQSAIERARELGVTPGGLIMIQGLARRLGWLGKPHRLVDWTSGCIGLSNFEIEQLFKAVKVGAPVEIGLWQFSAGFPRAQPRACVGANLFAHCQCWQVACE